VPTRLGRRSAPAPTPPRRRPPRVLRAGVARYAAALRIAGAVRYYAASLPIRLGAAILSLSMLVLIRHATGGYATAGAVVGTLAVAGTVGGPFTARITDRYGPRRVLPPLVTGNALGVVGLVAAVTAAAPVPLWYAAAIVAGLCTPAAGALTRARWSTLAPDRTVLSTGFALESLTDDLTFVVGPVLATVLGSLIQPVLAPLLAALLVLLGGVAMAIQRHPERAGERSAAHAATREPSGARGPSMATGPGESSASSGTSGLRRRRIRRGAAGALATPALRVLAGAFVATGVVFSGVQVSIAAVTSGYGHAAAAGPVYG
jgi:MFS family permease